VQTSQHRSMTPHRTVVFARHPGHHLQTSFQPTLFMARLGLIFTQFLLIEMA
jgi:hypothetical protein